MKPQAYFETYNEAYEALLEYNKNPYDLDALDTTVHELYDKWFADYSKTIKDSSKRTITSAWEYCSSIYDMSVKSVRARHLIGTIDNATAVINGEKRVASANTKSRMKSIFNLMWDYALEYELTDRNYARTFNLSDDIVKEKENVKRGHLSFTKDALNKLWNNIGLENSYIDLILFQCYSGWRPQELGLLKLENVDLDKMEIIGGMKTDAGTNRMVPIHPKVKDIVVNRYKEAKNLNSKYLFNCTDFHRSDTGLRMTYDKFEYRFTRTITKLQLNPDHRPHDGRKTFVTLCKNSDVNDMAIKYMVGHSIKDITEVVYTDRDPQWLHNEILKIQ